MDLKSARENYLAGQITFSRLETIFFCSCTTVQELEYYDAPEMDRSSVVIGREVD